MTAWLTDRLPLLTTGRLPGRGVVAGGTAALLISWMLPAEASAYVKGAGLCALVYAVVRAGARLIDMEGDGRLDQLRLSGAPPRRLFWTLTAGAAAPWVLVGVMLLASGIFQEPDGTDWSTGVGIIGGAYTCMLALVIRAQGEPRIDTRLIGAGLALAATIAAAQYWWQPPPIGNAGAARQSPITVVAILTAELMAILVLQSRAIRAIARPAPAGKPHPPFAGSLPEPAYLVGVGRRRIVATCALYAINVGITVLFMLFFKYSRPERAWDEIDFMFLVCLAAIPIVIGALLISSRRRTEIDSGRLDLMRIIPVRPVRTFLIHVIGVWLEFVLVTGTGILTVRLLWGRWPPGILPGLLIFSTLAPLPILEGWQRRWPLTYVAPVAVALTMLVGQASSPGAMGLLFVCWIPWVAAFRVFCRPERSALSGWTGAAAAAGIAIAVWWAWRGAP